MAEGYEQDVFVSYATDDGSAVALPLAEELATAGLRVWQDGLSMTAGDELEPAIVHGIATSRWTVLVISPGYLKRGRRWTQREAELAQRLTEERGTKVVIPIWYGVNETTIRPVNPWLTEHLGFIPPSRGFRLDIAETARHVLSVVDPNGATKRALATENRDRQFREELTSVASRLASDLPVTVRVRALAELGELADRSPALRRQECADLLCRVVRSAGSQPADDEIRAAAVEQAVLRMTGSSDKATRWSDMHLDFSGARFSSLNMSNVEIRGGLVDFQDVRFDGDHFSFWQLIVDAPLPWQGLRFGGAHLERGVLYFDRARWLAGGVDFSGMTFGSGEMQFRGGTFVEGVGTRNSKPFPPSAPPDDRVMRIGRIGLLRESSDDSNEITSGVNDGTGLLVRIYRDQYSGQL